MTDDVARIIADVLAEHRTENAYGNAWCLGCDWQRTRDRFAPSITPLELAHQAEMIAARLGIERADVLHGHQHLREGGSIDNDADWLPTPLFRVRGLEAP